MKFDLSPLITYFTVSDYLDLAARIILSAICGAIIGLEREKRYKNAGLRTHVIVAISASILMMVSKYGFIDVASIEGIRLTSDAGRIAAGVIQSIGFLGAGVIFVRKENIIGLTTAAGLWATVGIGLCFGSGMYILGISATLIIILTHFLFSMHHEKLATQTVGIISCNLTQHGITIKEIIEKFQGSDTHLRDFSCTRKDGEEIIKANVVFSDKKTLMDHVSLLESFTFIDSFEVYP